MIISSFRTAKIIIRYMLCGIDHPQINGKLERLNYIIKRLRSYFNT